MNRHLVKEIAAALVVVALVGSPILLVTARAQNAPGGFPDLVGMLKATSGVLGVDAGSMMSRKQVIFAWFENKKALLAWYYSDAHMALMQQFAEVSPVLMDRSPACQMMDARVLVIASVTLAGRPPTNAADLVSVPQIAIELYAPLPGGLASGGRFAPSSVRVPGMIEVPAGSQPAATGQ